MAKRYCVVYQETNGTWRRSDPYSCHEMADTCLDFHRYLAGHEEAFIDDYDRSLKIGLPKSDPMDDGEDLCDKLGIRRPWSTF